MAAQSRCGQRIQGYVGVLVCSGLPISCLGRFSCDRPEHPYERRPRSAASSRADPVMLQFELLGSTHAGHRADCQAIQKPDTQHG
jgi:hypothetical protein